MNLLYFWRGDNYRRDLDHGVGFHLNQASPLLHQILSTFQSITATICSLCLVLYRVCQCHIYNRIGM